MGGATPWQEKFLRLIREATGKSRPIKVLPRRSGPVEVPSDWWSPAHQRTIAEQCVLCHQRRIEGSPPLKRGLCGPCWQRTAEADDAA